MAPCWKPLFTYMLGGGGTGVGLRRSSWQRVWVWGWIAITHNSSHQQPWTLLQWKKKKEQTTPSIPHYARGPDDVICHLQLMKVMMTCMSAAYVYHLLVSAMPELLCAMLQRGSEAGLWCSISVPWHVRKTATCIQMTHGKFNHTFTPQAAKLTSLWGNLFLCHLSCQDEPTHTPEKYHYLMHLNLRGAQHMLMSTP